MQLSESLYRLMSLPHSCILQRFVHCIPQSDKNREEGWASGRDDADAPTQQIFLSRDAQRSGVSEGRKPHRQHRTTPVASAALLPQMVGQSYRAARAARLPARARGGRKSAGGPSEHPDSRIPIPSLRRPDRLPGPVSVKVCRPDSPTASPMARQLQ